jgi:hypothetical protein
VASAGVELVADGSACRRVPFGVFRFVLTLAAYFVRGSLNADPSRDA